MLIRCLNQSILGHTITSNHMEYKMEQTLVERFKNDKHFKYSVIKSGLRIAGGFALAVQWFAIGGLLFVAAEVFGVVEEL